MAAPIGPLWDLARAAGSRLEAAYQSFSGTDVAEAEVWRGVRDVYVTAAQGGDVEAAIVKADLAWRAEAEKGNRKVAEAAKVKRGPMAGHSCISHRWVSPDLFSTKVNHIRAMIAAQPKGTHENPHA